LLENSEVEVFFQEDAHFLGKKRFLAGFPTCKERKMAEMEIGHGPFKAA
jgi:hypothetical protein